MNSDSAEDNLFETGYEDFKQEFEKLSHIQLDFYKEKQMKRRINTLIERKKLSGYEAFLKLLKANAAELASFIDYITINVTEFFRTPDQWDVFETVALRDLAARKNRPLKIWSCACATGEEPYSLAISMLRYLDASEFRILATDIDDKVLLKAKAGVFDERSICTLPEEIRDQYFENVGDKYVAADILKQCILFQKLDLLRDDYPVYCDLIVCRNILIYFTEEGKERIYRKFLTCMGEGGYLFTGNTEQIIYYKAYGLKKVKNYLYQKQER